MARNFQMKLAKLKVNGINHQLYTWGSRKNPPIVFIHGWLDTGASFDFVAEHLKEHFYCVAPDLRGYGRSASSKNPLGYFIFEYVADLHEFLKKISPEEPVRLIGHSLGGLIASLYAGSFPERVSRFVNLEGFGFMSSGVEKSPGRLREWILDLGKQRFRFFKSKEAFAERLITSNPRLPMERALFLTDFLAKPTEHGCMKNVWTMRADPNHKVIEPYQLLKPYLYRFCESIKARCLLVSAEQTQLKNWLGEERYRRELKDRLSHYPKSSLKIVMKDVGHMMHHEKPEELARLLLSFLKRK